MNLCREYVRGFTVSNPQDVVEYCKEFKNQDREFFVVFGLNTAKRIIFKEIVCIGILDASVVHPREVFKNAIVKSANCIITVHNHPSGTLEPSSEDIHVWEHLNKAGEIIGITVLDNLIITQEGFYSSKK